MSTNFETNQRLSNTTDSFNKLIADNTRDKISISSTHDFSDERLKYLENDAETGFAGSAKTVDKDSEWVLNAEPGDKLFLEAQQRLTYIPGYELSYGIGWYAENELDDGQKIIVSLGNGVDAFRAVYTNEGAEYKLINNSEEKASVSFNNPVPLTQPQVDKGNSNMYGVGVTSLEKSYVVQNEDGLGFKQVNQKLANIADVDSVVTGEFNLKLRIGVDCTEASTGLNLNVLSLQAQDLGNTSGLTREKGFTRFGLDSINSTEWEPILALRKDNNRDSVPMNLTKLGIIPSDKMEVAAVAVNPEDTDATGFDTPEETNPVNDVTEITETVSTPVDPSIGRQTAQVVGTAQNRNQTTVRETSILTPVYDDDVVVFLARTASASNASVDLTVKSLQEW